MKKKVFIAIPGARRDNAYARHEADLAMQMLSRTGHQPVNPFDNDSGPGATEADRVADHLRMALDCQMVYLPPGRGADFGCSVIFHAVREWNATHPEQLISLRYGRQQE